MISREELIGELRKIEGNGYILPDGKVSTDLLDAMAAYIGDTDPDLRDELIYSAFDQWICVRKYINSDTLLSLLNTMLDENHLFYSLGRVFDDSVFTRTFSILIIVLIMKRHREDRILDSERFDTLKNKIFSYYTQEKDLRGYVEKLGWAHGAAHGSDALDELLQCKESGEAVFKEILDSYKKVLYNGIWLFANEEDERIARVVNRMIIKKALDEETMKKWFESLAECCDWEMTRSQYISRVNAKNFIRCLYFKLIRHKNKSELVETLVTVEKLLNRSLRFDPAG